MEDGSQWRRNVVEWSEVGRARYGVHGRQCYDAVICQNNARVIAITH